MKLTIKQRIYLPQIFAANKNTITEASVKRSIKELIIINQDEAKEINLRVDNGAILWDYLKGGETEYNFTREQLNYMRESVFSLSRSPDHDVSDDLLPLCELIMTF